MAAQAAVSTPAQNAQRERNPMKNLQAVIEKDPNAFWVLNPQGGEVVSRRHCMARFDTTGQWWFWHDNYYSSGRCPMNGIKIATPESAEAVLQMLKDYDYEGTYPKL
jgi:hypothetical protein